MNCREIEISDKNFRKAEVLVQTLRSRFAQGFWFQNSRSDFFRLERNSSLNPCQCCTLTCWFRLYWELVPHTHACMHPHIHLYVRVCWFECFPTASRKLWVSQRQSKATDSGSFLMMPYRLTLLMLVPYFSSSSEVLSLWSSWIPKERENNSEQAECQTVEIFISGSGECSNTWI